MRSFRLWLPLLAVAPLVACSSLQSSDSLLGFITPYRAEVVQGNVLTREMVAQVKPGLSRAQVRELLGSPLLTDNFHADRWDYVFTIRRQGAQPQQRELTALFEGDKLKSIEGGELPSEREFVDSIDTAKTPGKTRPLVMDDAALKALPTPAPTPPAASAPQGPVRNYPPLERS